MKEFFTGGNCFPPCRCLTLTDAGAATGDMELFKHSDFDFLGKKWPFIILSLILTAAGLISLGVKGGPRYGIDFRGGALITVSFRQSPAGGQSPRRAFRQAPGGSTGSFRQAGGHHRHRRAAGRRAASFPPERDRQPDAALSDSRPTASTTSTPVARPRWPIICATPWQAASVADVGPATADAGVRHHGLPEAALRADQESG